jgi:hypothetical protein
VLASRVPPRASAKLRVPTQPKSPHAQQLQQVDSPTPPHVVAQMRTRESELLQLVSELRGALAAAADKVDELEEREKATAAAHLKELQQEQEKSYSAGAQSQMSVRSSTSLHACIFIEPSSFLTPSWIGPSECKREAGCGHAADGA